LFPKNEKNKLIKNQLKPKKDKGLALIQCKKTMCDACFCQVRVWTSEKYIRDLDLLCNDLIPLCHN
jgi:cytochrome c peroxidase